MESIKPKTLKRLRETLIKCAPREPRRLVFLFTDDRLKPWRNTVPLGANSHAKRVEAIIGFLCQRYNVKNHRNALVLFVEVLRFYTDEDDLCYKDLDSLINELESEPEVGTSVSSIESITRALLLFFRHNKQRLIIALFLGIVLFSIMCPLSLPEIIEKAGLSLTTPPFTVMESEIYKSDDIEVLISVTRCIDEEEREKEIKSGDKIELFTNEAIIIKTLVYVNERPFTGKLEYEYYNPRNSVAPPQAITLGYENQTTYVAPKKPEPDIINVQIRGIGPPLFRGLRIHTIPFGED